MHRTGMRTIEMTEKRNHHGKFKFGELSSRKCLGLSSRANVERNFAQMCKVIYRKEQIFARKFEVNFRSERIIL